MRVVFDTCVWVAAIRSRRGAGFALLSEIPHGRFRFGISVPLFVEYRAKLLATSQSGASPLSEKQIDAVLNALAYYGQEVPIYYLLRPNLKNENDNLVFECAANFQADAIVTPNIRDFHDPELKGYDIDILSPVFSSPPSSPRRGRLSANPGCSPPMSRHGVTRLRGTGSAEPGVSGSSHPISLLPFLPLLFCLPGWEGGNTAIRADTIVFPDRSARLRQQAPACCLNCPSQSV